MPQSREYSEDVELTFYVWNHYSHFMTPFERRVNVERAVALKEAGGYSTRFVERIRERYKLGESEVLAALADGVEAFRQRVATRLLREHANEIFVNRCPRCNRILRTPRAQQCLWCGYDWHPR